MPIRDHFSYDPGRYFWAATWFYISGDNGIFWWRFAGALFGALCLGSAYVSMRLAGLPFPARVWTLLLLVVALSYPRHKVYEQGLSLLATAGTFFALLYCRPTAWFVLGLTSALAAIIGRNSGLYFCIAAAAGLAFQGCRTGFRGAFRSWLAYCGGLFVGYLPIVCWLLRDRAFANAMLESVKFTSSWQIPLPIPFPWRVEQKFQSVAEFQLAATSWLSLTTFVLYAFAVVEFIMHNRRYRNGEPVMLLRLAAVLVGLPYLHQGFYRADFGHIAQGILPVFVYIATWLPRRRRSLPWVVAIFWWLPALGAWLPNVPTLNAWNANRLRPGAIMEKSLGGSNLVIDAAQAGLIDGVEKVVRACEAGKEQVVTMPYYPGMLPAVNRSSPLWDLYYLYPRSTEFQNKQVARLDEAGVKVVLINTEAAVDQREDLKIGRTNPVIVNFIQSNFDLIKTLEDGGKLYVRNCRESGDISRGREPLP